MAQAPVAQPPAVSSDLIGAWRYEGGGHTLHREFHGDGTGFFNVYFYGILEHRLQFTWEILADRTGPAIRVFSDYYTDWAYYLEPVFNP